MARSDLATGERPLILPGRPIGWHRQGKAAYVGEKGGRTMRTPCIGLLAVAMMSLARLAVASASPSADLSITNTTLPNPATLGKNLTYGMNIINNGPETATNVRVTDALPAGVTLV